MQGGLGCWDTESRMWWLLCQSFAHVGIQGKDFDPKTCIFFECKEVVWGLVRMIRSDFGSMWFLFLSIVQQGVCAVTVISGVNVLSNQDPSISGQEAEDVAH